MLGLKISPELIIFLPLALMLDAIGIVLVLFGLDDLGILDTVGLFSLGAWIWLRDGTRMISPKKMRKKGFRFLGTYIGESIPYLGALPFWTIMTLFTLKDSSAPGEESTEELSQEETKDSDKQEKKNKQEKKK